MGGMGGIFSLALAKVGGEEIESVPNGGSLHAGQDVRMDLCIRNLTVTVNPPVLAANGSDRADINAKYQGCTLEKIKKLPISYTQSPVGGNNGALKFSGGITDDDGRFENVFTAGKVEQDYVITVVLEIGSATVEEQVTVSVIKAPTIAYKFEQTILDFREEGSSRWPDFNLEDPTVTVKFPSERTITA